LSEDDPQFNERLVAVEPPTTRLEGCEGAVVSPGGGVGAGSAGAGADVVGTGRVSHCFLTPLSGSPKTPFVQLTPFASLRGVVKTPFAP
jgi:hypothetical protein